MEGFSFGKGSVSTPFYQYKWMSDKDRTKGELHIAVCPDRNTAEYLWRLRLSGFSKYSPSNLGSGKVARYGDVEYVSRSAILFLRDSIFCEVQGHEGETAEQLVASAERLASRLARILSQDHKRLAGVARRISITEFSAEPNPAESGEEVALRVQLKGAPDMSKVKVRYICDGGQIQRKDADRWVFIGTEEGDYEVRTFVMCPANVVLSRSTRISVDLRETRNPDRDK